MLANLGLTGAKRELSQEISTKKPRISTLGVQRVKRAARKRKPKLPPRRSLRVQGKDADGKELPPNFKEPNKHGGGGYETKEEKLSIQGNVEVDEDGKTFLQSLRMASSASGKGKRRSSRVKQEMGSDYHSRKSNEDSDASTVKCLWLLTRILLTTRRIGGPVCRSNKWCPETYKGSYLLP